ncbi:MAG TPA: hypothetical protein VL282_08285 [Tepidisphaeraceae bacterium]|jgi:hypothetical protein|nr:hypothetical protein [Tepidisphaeraceae bacterium]
MLNRSHRIAIVAVVFTMLLADRSLGDFQSLAKKLPPETNVLVAINVAKILNSPYSKQQDWAGNLAEKWQTRPLMVPPGVNRLVMGADLDPKTIDSTWQMCLMEMLQMPSMDSIAQAHRGYVDRVWDKNAIVSPQNAYFVPLDDKTLASLTPASRRTIAKWLRQPADGGMTSVYLKTVAMGLSDNTDITMALDLEGAFAVPAARKWLDDNEMPEFKGQNLDAIARQFGHINGLRLDVSIDNDINARGTVSFDQDAAVLGPVAKPLTIGILKYAGMALPDLDDWKFATSGKTVTMEGKLSEASLRNLLSLVQSPIPSTGTTDSTAANQTPAGQPLDPAVASQKYYKFICMILDNLSAKTSLADTSTWFKNSARRIEQAPILNVDPALVEWGAMVTTKLKEVAAMTAIGQTQTSARAASLQSSAVDYGAYTYDASGKFYSKVSAEGEANRQQRRQAASEQKAQAQQQGAQMLADIPSSRAKIRTEMTAKYKIEF